MSEIRSFREGDKVCCIEDLEDLKIGDLVEVVGPTIFENLSQLGKIFQIDRIDSDGDIISDGGDWVFSPSSLRRVIKKNLPQYKEDGHVYRPKCCDWCGKYLGKSSVMDVDHKKIDAIEKQQKLINIRLDRHIQSHEKIDIYKNHKEIRLCDEVEIIGPDFEGSKDYIGKKFKINASWYMHNSTIVYSGRSTLWYPTRSLKLVEPYDLEIGDTVKVIGQPEGCIQYQTGQIDKVLKTREDVAGERYLLEKENRWYSRSCLKWIDTSDQEDTNEV